MTHAESYGGPRLRRRPPSLQEEGEYEWAAYHPGENEGREEAHMEEGVLYQPLGGEGAGEGTSLLGSAIPLCMASPGGPCSHFEVLGPELSIPRWLGYAIFGYCA